MKKFFPFLILLLSAACSNNNSIFKKSKTIVELSPRFVLETSEPIGIESSTPVYSLNLGSKKVALTKGRIISQPLIIDDCLYFIDDRGGIGAFSLSGQKILWKRDLVEKPENKYLGGGIEYFGGNLYVTNGSRFLVIVNSDNGAEIIRKKFPDILRTKPTILKNGIILVQTIANQIFGYEPSRGAIVWQHESLAETLSSGRYVRPIEYKDHLIINYTSGTMFSISLKEGREEWVMNLGDLGNYISLPGFSPLTLSCDPIVDGNDIYAASSTGKLWKINMDDGSTLWKVDAPDVQSSSKIGRTIFVVGNAKQLAGIDLGNGKVKFLAELSSSEKTQKDPAIFLPPFLAKTENNVSLNVVNNKGELYEFALSEGMLSNIPTIKKIQSDIKYVLFSEKDQSLYLLTDKYIVYNDSRK